MKIKYREVVLNSPSFSLLPLEAGNVIEPASALPDQPDQIHLSWVA